MFVCHNHRETRLSPSHGCQALEAQNNLQLYIGFLALVRMGTKMIDACMIVKTM